MEENFIKKLNQESERLSQRFPDRIAVFVEKNKRSDVQDIDKNKFLVPVDTTIGSFLCILRKRIKLTPEKSIFIFVDNKIPPSHYTMAELYNSQDGSKKFIHIIYSSESTFG